jgi:hypothetical protein
VTAHPLRHALRYSQDTLELLRSRSFALPTWTILTPPEVQLKASQKDHRSFALQNYRANANS